MKPDGRHHLLRPRRPYQAAGRFFGLLELLVRAFEPTQTQLDALESSYRSTSDFLVNAPEFEGLLTEVHGHGSRQLGTLIRPLDETREGFDIDLIARLARAAAVRYGGASGPVRLLDHLHAVLARYARQHGLRVQRWERCVTLEYAGGMCADIAPVIDDPLVSVPFGATHGRIPDRALQSYEATNPRGYNRFFDGAARTAANLTGAARFAEALTADAAADIAPLPAVSEVFERLLCRLIQLLKIHRNVAFASRAAGRDAAPTSVFVTTLAAKAYAVQAPLAHDNPLELLLDIVETLPDHFVRAPLGKGEFWYLENPSAPRDNLASGMNDSRRQESFAWWHGRLTSQLASILDAIEQQQGMDVVLARIEEAFGERATRTLRSELGRHRMASRSIGRVALIAATGVPVAVAARSHTFYGRD